MAKAKKPKRRFGIAGFYGWAKSLRMGGFNALELEVDWDDVDHVETAQEFQKVCRILEDHWDDPKYAISPIDLPEEDDGGGESPAYTEAKQIMKSLVIH